MDITIAVVTTCVVIVLGVLITSLILIRKEVSLEQRSDALLMFLEKIQGYYLCSIPLYKWLSANLVTRARQEQIGDYARVLGGAVLHALDESGMMATMYYRWVDSGGNIRYATLDQENDSGHYDVFIQFYHNRAWWRFEVSQPLNSRNLMRVSTKDYEEIQECYRVDLWFPGRVPMRKMFARCVIADDSFLPPVFLPAGGEFDEESARNLGEQVCKMAGYRV